MKPSTAIGCLIPILGLAASEALPQPMTTEELLQGAAERIDQYRKADAVVQVITPDGEPIEGATVQVRMTRHRFLFGCNLFGWDSQPTPEDQETYRARFADLFNYATLPFYWWSYGPEPDYSRVTAMAEWCADHGIVTKGHPLVWNYAAPEWLPQDTTAIRALLDARVSDCVARFSGLIDRWDVVNEATDPFRFDNPVTDAWREAGRVEYTRHAFVLARQANPAAILLINDYRLDDEYVALCDALRDQDARPLYDAIGLQSHQHGGAMPPEHIWAACERFAPFGVPLHWTENTIVSGPRVDGQWSGTTPEGEALQADQVALFYTIAFSHPATEAITWWDLSDRYAWMEAPAGLLREDLSPKPAYDRLVSLIRGDWWTQKDLVTTEDGAAPFRGFHGDYLITVEAEGAQVTIETSLGPEAPGRILVQISR